MMTLPKLFAATAVLAFTSHAMAISPADKCEADKNRIAGKYAFCRQKVEATSIRTGASPNFTLCGVKLGAKWLSAENKAAGMCPTNGDYLAVLDFVSAHTDAVAAALNGDGLPACGDDTIDVAGEQCDGTALAGASCSTLGLSGGTLGCGGGCAFDTSGCTCSVSGGLPETGQTQCDPGDTTLAGCPGNPSGQDGERRAGVPRSYTDNGDGTISDNVTGLMWEKLSNDGSVHDQGNFYNWYTVGTTKIATLNAGSGFAGHTDWRLPNVLELESIVDLGQPSSPTIDPIFNAACPSGCTVTTCSCAHDGSFMSSTTSQANSDRAWLLSFGPGDLFPFPKSTNAYARAVRGGS